MISLFFWQELNSRAQGEVSIREALRELELWGAGAVFSLTSYVDSHNKELSIIKDWKDLVNQVKKKIQLWIQFAIVRNCFLQRCNRATFTRCNFYLVRQSEHADLYAIFYVSTTSQYLIRFDSYFLHHLVSFQGWWQPMPAAVIKGLSLL